MKKVIGSIRDFMVSLENWCHQNLFHYFGKGQYGFTPRACWEAVWNVTCEITGTFVLYGVIAPIIAVCDWRFRDGLVEGKLYEVGGWNLRTSKKDEKPEYMLDVEQLVPVEGQENLNIYSDRVLVQLKKGEVLLLVKRPRKVSLWSVAKEIITERDAENYKFVFLHPSGRNIVVQLRDRAVIWSLRLVNKKRQKKIKS